MGRAARDLIEHPSYVDAMQALEAYHVAAMVAAPEGPKGSEVREHHHRMTYALRELAGELALRVSAAHQVEQNLKDDDNEDDIT